MEIVQKKADYFDNGNSQRITCRSADMAWKNLAETSNQHAVVELPYYKKE